VSLEAAVAHLEAGRPGAALEVMLDTWRGRRLPALADELDRLSAHLAAAFPPLTGRTREALHEAWLDALNEWPAAGLGRLLEHFAAPPWVHVGERIERLSLLDDPRVTRAFAAFVEALPTAGGIGSARWTLVMKRLQQSNDVRVVRPLEARLAIGDERFLVAEYVHRLSRRVLAGLVDVPCEPADVAGLAALRAAVDETLRRPVPRRDALVEERSARRPARSDEELLALVYDAPADDGPRLVYADWLEERGHPRAELLMLQLKARPTKKDERRAKHLVRAQGRQWLGPLEPALRMRTEGFSRGFVSEGQVEFPTSGLRERLLGHPAWNTLLSLSASTDTDGEFLVRTELKGLERLELGRLSLGALEGRPWPFRRVTALRLGVLPPAELHALSPAQFPAVREVSCAVREGEAKALVAALARVPPVLRQATRLELVGLASADVLAVAQALPVLERLTLVRGAKLSFERREGGWVLDVAPSSWMITPKDHLGALVREFLPHLAGVLEPSSAWAERRAAARASLEGALVGTAVPLLARRPARGATSAPP
jgi:uncharacterized protein (TIGR02996 family)